MRKIILLLVIALFHLSVFAQNVPVINAELDKWHKPITDKAIKEFNKLEPIHGKIYGENKTELTDAEEKFRQYMYEKYENAEDGLSIWNIHDIGCSWYCGGTYVIEVSSELATVNGIKYGISELNDDDMRTAWVEGAEGYGIGESITFAFAYNAARATNVLLVNGYAKSEATWKNNSRVKQFKIYDDDKLIAVVNLLDTRSVQTFELPYPFPKRPDNYNRSTDNSDKTVKLKFVIADVYKGDKYEDTAISEFIFDGIDVHCLAKGTQITTIGKSLKNIEDIKENDIVTAYSVKDGNITTALVHKIHKAQHNKMLKLTFENGIEIITTADHPFLAGVTWMSYNPEKTKQYNPLLYLVVNKYDVGTSFHYYKDNKTGFTKIKSIEHLEGDFETYPLELDDENKTFIANGLYAGQE